MDNTYTGRSDGGRVYVLPRKDQDSFRHGAVLLVGGFLVALSLSMYLMARAARSIPLGTVYPVWTGIGAVGAVIVGIVFFHEPANFWRIFFITTLIISIVGLKMV